MIYDVNENNLIENYPEAKAMRETLLNSFQGLIFNEDSHTYWYNNEKLPSVSSLIKYFYEDFDEITKVKYCEKMGFDIDDVSIAWIGEGDIANATGHRVHLFGENYVNWRWFGIGERPKPKCKQELAVLQFWNDIENKEGWAGRFIPIFTEIRMFSTKYGYAGTADILCWDTKTKKIVIMDYKTNKDLYSSFNKKALILGETTDLLQDNYSKYNLQFSFYRILLEEAGFQVAGQILIWLREQERNTDTRKKDLYKPFNTKNYTKELREFLSNLN